MDWSTDKKIIFTYSVLVTSELLCCRINGKPKLRCKLMSETKSSNYSTEYELLLKFYRGPLLFFFQLFASCALSSPHVEALASYDSFRCSTLHNLCNLPCVNTTQSMYLSLCSHTTWKDIWDVTLGIGHTSAACASASSWCRTIWTITWWPTPDSVLMRASSVASDSVRRFRSSDTCAYTCGWVTTRLRTVLGPPQLTGMVWHWASASARENV